MFKKTAILIVLFLAVTMIFSSIAFSAKKAKTTEENLAEVEEALKKQRATADLVSPDSVHTATAIKALYYQNIKITELLEQIRDLLKQNLEKKEEKE